MQPSKPKKHQSSVAYHYTAKFEENFYPALNPRAKEETAWVRLAWLR